MWPTPPGSNRVSVERLVLGSGGEVYYSVDHYKTGTFVRIR